MCFSANISFLTASLLMLVGSVGLASIYKAKSKSMLMVALIPILFAMQQFSEGIVWLTKVGTLTNSIAAYTFISFAMLVWPLWMPTAVLQIEPDPQRKSILKALLVAGIIWVIYLIYCLINYPLNITNGDMHIVYSLDFDNALKSIATILYLVPGALPFLVSSVKNIWLFGVLITLSCFITYLFWINYFVSVWCFFAALLSFFVLKIILQK